MRGETLVAGLLLAIFAFLSVTSAATWSATSDEVPHLAAGYSYLQTGDFRLNPQHPPLMKALAAVPLCFLDLKRVDELPGWKEAKDRDFGHAFLLENYEPLPRLLFLGRLPMIAVTLLLGVGLFLWAREIWGFRAAAWVLLCFALSPSLLAHGSLVTTDAGLACFTLWALYALWRWSETRSRRDAVACGVAVGLALLAKYSGLLTLGMVCLLVVAVATERRASPRVALGALLGIVAPAALLITVGYGFPKGLLHYARGIGQINRDFDMSQPAFLWGAHSEQGFWYYYLLAQLWKTPLPILIMFGAALVTLRARDDRERIQWIFILAPIGVFHLAGAFYRPNIGLRHVLPALPFILLATGDVARRAALSRRGRVVLALLALWQVVGVARTYPHFLAYFNELAGGPANGAHYLGDSNLEWGQDISGMREAIERERPRHVRAAVFAPLPLDAQGIGANEPLKLRDLVWPEEGVDYFVGTGFLQRPAYLRDNPAVRFRWPERYAPVETIGWSIYVYRFSTDPSDRGRREVTFVPKERWYEDARAQLEQILSFTPNFADARRVLARVYEERSAWRAENGESGAALDDALRALAIEATPERRALARRACDAYARSAAAADDGADASCILAETRARGGEVARAVRGLIDCLRRSGDDVTAAARLAELYERLGLIVLARQEWERCLRVDPANAAASAALARLPAAEEAPR